MVRSVIILEAVMPSAVFNYILAERYQQSPGEVSSVIALSTVIVFLLLPLLLPLLL